MPSEGNTKVARVWPVIRAYAKAARRYPWLIGIVFLSGLVIELLAIIAPLYLKRLIDILASEDPATATMSILLGIIAMFALVHFGKWAGNRIQVFSINRVEMKIMADLSNDAFRYLLGHSYDFFVSNFAGALTRRVGRYSRAFEQILDTLVYNFLSTTVFAFGAVFVLFQRSMLLGSILLVWTIVFVALQVLLARWKQPLRTARVEEDTRMMGALSDAVSNQSTVTLFAARKHEYSIFGRTVERWRAATMRSWNADAWIAGFQAFFELVIEVGLLVAAVVLWQRGLITVGDFVLIQIYVIGLIDRVWGIGSSMRRIYEAFADAYEMVEVFQKPHGIADAPGAKPLSVKAGTIDMKDVGFTFTGGHPVLSGFTLDVNAGEKVALVGPSGAGKSTVTKLLLRLYDVTEGSIGIDGQDIAKVTQDSLREAIAFVPQEPILFHRSLMDNIRYGRLEATDEEVYEAAKKARCHDFISGFPLGYDTHVGERGVKLSGGERQRVAIARAILKNAPILILDEATSSLDSESESLIQEALKALMEGKTVLVIAHRLSTIMHMDRIVVMEEGRIAAGGTHDELLDHKGGLYHKLWSIQAGSFVADTEA
ncbi:MAG: ATP-binding cassette, subfamily bacterial [Candidatus Parcubacteria bacterium]|jgi:ATP-binding cassette subfamily B protein|nr:ATP-binding cassette, subfamily bacterial [Candidatus Parcubacteria bacterium]